MSSGVSELDEPEREAELGGEVGHRAGIVGLLQRINQRVDKPAGVSESRDLGGWRLRRVAK